MRRIALLLVALLALAAVAGAADARPRKTQRKVRGQVSVLGLRLPGALARLQRPDAPATLPVGDPALPAAALPPPLPPAPPPPAGSGRSVQVTTDDADPEHLRLTLSRTTVLAGSVKITFNNAFAQDPHNLLLEGPGEPVLFDELPKGEVAVRTVTLAAGAWRVYCALEGHETNGMAATLTVAPT